VPPPSADALTNVTVYVRTASVKQAYTILSPVIAASASASTVLSSVFDHPANV